MGFAHATGADAYLEVHVLTATPWQLIDDMLSAAIVAILKKNLTHAFNIVNEGLFASIDPKMPLADKFAASYEFILRNLLPAGNPDLAKKELTSIRALWAKLKLI